MMRKLFFFTAFLLFVLFAGCGGEGGPVGSDADVTDDSSDESGDSYNPSDSSGQDVAPRQDATGPDNGDSPDPADSVTTDGDEDATHDAFPDAADVVSDIPGVAREIDEAMDSSFMAPNRGLALKIVAPLIDEIGENGPAPETAAWVLSGEIVLPSGRTVPLSNRATAWTYYYPGTGQDDAYVYINADSGNADERYLYTVNVIPYFSSLNWMKSEGVSTTSGDYFWVVVYRSGYFDSDTYVTCPVLVGASKSQSQMYVHFDQDTLTVGSPLGVMVNSYLTDDRDEIIYLNGVSNYESACQCYDVGGVGTPTRVCTAADIDQLPGRASAVSPSDGSEGLDAPVTLKWQSAGDPDGGQVAYDVYFGTDNPPATKLSIEPSATQATVEASPDTTYFWRVNVTDDEGNMVAGPVWSFNTDSDVPTLGEHNYLIIVNRTLKGRLDAEIAQYVDDVIDETGLKPAVRYWMPGDHVALKALIRDSYEKWGIVGAFLIGDMPSAWYEQDSDFGEPIGIMHEEFPTELYFQDMDGTWTDADGNGMFDAHPELALELFTARLVGGEDRIRAYLNKLHAYRAEGSFFDTRNFFSFIDDDWNGANSYGYQDPSTTGQKWGLESIYGDNYERREWSDNTSKQEYLDFMSAGGAEFVYQWIHSDPQRIYFDDNFSPNPDNILTLDELVAHDVQGSFFNLFDCSISRYTEVEGNIATEYLHSEKGLATIGSTKTGGIFNPEVLYGALLDGDGFGSALMQWFNDTWANRYSYGFDNVFFDGWWLGMMIQGDPLVTINPPARNRSFVPAPSSRYWSHDELKRLNETMGRQAVSTTVSGYRDYIKSRTAVHGD